MSHTFIKENDHYLVGIWLRSFHRPGTDQFNPMLKVKTLRGAIRITAVLNGGSGNIDSVVERTEVKDAEEGASLNGGEDNEGAARRAAVVRRPRAKARHVT